MEFEVKSPILGFENVLKMELQKIDDVFMKLYNVDSNHVPSFTLINPFVLRDYNFEVPTAIEVLLDINNESKDILIANIVVVYKEIKDSTINFLAPIIFNFSNKTMAQVVLDALKYPNYGINESISKYLKQ